MAKTEHPKKQQLSEKRKQTDTRKQRKCQSNTNVCTRTKTDFLQG